MNPPPPSRPATRPPCACETGEDCEAIAAADERVIVAMDVAKGGSAFSAWTLTRGHLNQIGDVLTLSDGREVTQYVLPATVRYDERKEALHSLIDGLHGWKTTRPVEDVPTAEVTGKTITIRKGHWGRTFEIAKLWDLPDVSEPFGPVIEFSAKLDGLTAKLDAIAERLPDPDAHMIRVISPSTHDREGDIDVWYLDPEYEGHGAPFAMGDAVTNSSASHGIYQVLSVGQRYGDKKIALRLQRHPGFVFDREAF